MTKSHFPSMAHSEHLQSAYWLRICGFVVITMAVSWLALWGASQHRRGVAPAAEMLNTR
jgi:hypothetical protein